MTPIFYHNFTNGFSGGNLFVGYYYGLFRIHLTNFAQMVSLLLDTEVDYDFKKYGEESVAADEDKLKTYNPVNIEWSKLKY